MPFFCCFLKFCPGVCGFQNIVDILMRFRRFDVNQAQVAPQGFTEEEFEKLKSRCGHEVEASQQEYQGAECPICLCPFDEGNQVVQFRKCIHLFHTECLEQWLKINPTCPMCKSEKRQEIIGDEENTATNVRVRDTSEEYQTQEIDEYEENDDTYDEETPNIYELTQMQESQKKLDKQKAQQRSSKSTESNIDDSGNSTESENSLKESLGAIFEDAPLKK